MGKDKSEEKVEPTLEENEQGLVDPVLQELVADDEEVKPQADFLMGSSAAEEWLAKAYKRVKNAYRSVLFDADLIKDEHVHFLLKFAADSVVTEYRVGRRRGELHRGVLYVPGYLVSVDELSDFDVVDHIGSWAAMSRKKAE
jgi:hypothetical protein